eukprot:6487784-Amphidinium_carterae.3
MRSIGHGKVGDKSTSLSTHFAVGHKYLNVGSTLRWLQQVPPNSNIRTRVSRVKRLSKRSQEVYNVLCHTSLSRTKATIMEAGRRNGRCLGSNPFWPMLDTRARPHTVSSNVCVVTVPVVPAMQCSGKQHLVRPDASNEHQNNKTLTLKAPSPGDVGKLGKLKSIFAKYPPQSNHKASVTQTKCGMLCEAVSEQPCLHVLGFGRLILLLSILAEGRAGIAVTGYRYPTSQQGPKGSAANINLVHVFATLSLVTSQLRTVNCNCRYSPTCRMYRQTHM